MTESVQKQPMQELTPEQRKKIDALMEQGKAAGKLSSKVLIDTLDAMGADDELSDRIYEQLESAGIEIDISDVMDVIGKPLELTPTEEELQNTADEVVVEDPNALAETFKLDDPMRMYLKEIGKKRIAAKLVAVRLLPFWVLSRIYGIPRDGGDREASIIFTRGSEGMPKAAVLTHRNIMANCVQMWNIGLINSDTRLHANLPLFHSFGQTIQVWMTAIYGMQSVTVQSPLETGGLFFFLKRRGIALQCWSPYQVGFFEGSLFLHPEMEKAQECLADLSKKYGVSPEAIRQREAKAIKTLKEKLEAY